MVRRRHKIAAAAVAAVVAVGGGIAASQSGSSSQVLPNSRLTPGVVDTAVTTHIVCTQGTQGRRSVPQSVKDAVKREYGVSSTFKGEIDHLISLELGGSNDIKNLWPQAGKIPNAKDGLENLLHAQVCQGKITLAQAQRDISTNWIKAYVKYEGHQP